MEPPVGGDGVPASKKVLGLEQWVVGPEASLLGLGLASGSTEQQGGKETMCEIEVDQTFGGKEKSSLLDENRRNDG